MGYPKGVYEKAWQELDRRRSTSQQILLKNQEEIRNKIPEIAHIQRRMVGMSTRITKAVLTEPKRAKELVEELARENLALQEERKKLLISEGYTADYLAEKYVCAYCSDTGYVGTHRCDCFKKILKEEAFKQLSHISDSNLTRFDDFRLDFYPAVPGTDGIAPRQRMSEILEFCREYARSFNPKSPSLVMMGRTGLGKTHLSLSIAWEVTLRGFGVVYTPVQRLMDKLESQKFSYSQEDKQEYAQNVDSIMECDLLVLDDLGTEFQTSFTGSVLYNIVNTRMVEGRPTIINTNLEPIELEKNYSQRMASRLGFGYKILRFYGDDIRYVRRAQRHGR